MINFLVLLFPDAVIFVGRITGEYIGEKHRATETIINTGTPPITWICNSIKKMAELREDPIGLRAVKIEGKSRETYHPFATNLA